MCCLQGIKSAELMHRDCVSFYLPTIFIYIFLLLLNNSVKLKYILYFEKVFYIRYVYITNYVITVR